MHFILGGTGFQPVVFTHKDGEDARPTIREAESSQVGRREIHRNLTLGNARQQLSKQEATIVA